MSHAARAVRKTNSALASARDALMPACSLSLPIAPPPPSLPDERGARMLWQECSAPLRILCIDGGGIKGLVPAVVIQRLEEICGNRPVHELFDLVCGTSTGGAAPTLAPLHIL